MSRQIIQDLRLHFSDVSGHKGEGVTMEDVSRGFSSCWFSVRELSAALARARAAGGGGGGGGEWTERALRSASGAAAAAAGAPLAGDVCARAALLEAGARGLRLLVGGAAVGGAVVGGAGGGPPTTATPLPMWFDDTVLAALRMPFLTLANIKGGSRYECHECGARFERPNPLKLHLFLRCGHYEPAAFWARALPRLAAAVTAPPVPAAPPMPPAAAPHPARLEALAAEWGRARGGHACVYCGKLYSRKYGLKIHIRTHTGYKPLRCRYCARAFGDPSNLNKHVRLHAGSAPGPAGAAPAHACSLCGQRLARRRDLERHVRARHALAAV